MIDTLFRQHSAGPAGRKGNVEDRDDPAPWSARKKLSGLLLLIVGSWMLVFAPFLLL
jgi:hypothetical protein